MFLAAPHDRSSVAQIFLSLFLFLLRAALVECVWDPLSSSQTLKLVSLLKGLVQDFPTVGSEHKNTQALLKAAVMKMRQAIDNDIFIPLIATK